jgi:hypothetical protein
MQGQGFFGDVWDGATKIVKTAVKSVGQVAKAGADVYIKPSELLGDIVKGKNVINAIKNRGTEYGTDLLHAAAAPTNLLHTVTGPLGIKEEADLLITAFPSVGTMMTLSQVAQTVEEVMELKRKAEAEQAKIKKDMDKLAGFLDDLDDADWDDLIAEAKEDALKQKGGGFREDLNTIKTRSTQLRLFPRFDMQFRILQRNLAMLLIRVNRWIRNEESRDEPRDAMLFNTRAMLNEIKLLQRNLRNKRRIIREQ